MKKLILAILATASLLSFAPVAQADYNPGCDQVPWGFLGSQKRLICDTPRFPDGHWERFREVFLPAGYIPLYCSSYSCSGGYYRERTTVEFTHYPVTDDTVWEGEPGWLPEGALSLR